MQTMTFAFIRYFIVPEEGNVFLQPKTDEEKRRAFMEAVLSNQEHTTKRGRELAIKMLGSEESVYFGKLARKTFTKNYRKTDDDFLEEMLEGWPFLYFACDTKSQLIALEVKSIPLLSLSTVCRILREMTIKSLSMLGYLVQFQILPEKGAFWDIVDGSLQVFSVRFSLNSPNLFGAEIKTNELLKRLANTFHNTSTTLEIENKKGELILSRDELQDAVNYAEAGGGNWRVTAKLEGQKKRTRHKSDDRILKTQVEVAEEAKEEEVFEAMRTVMRDRS